MNSFDHQRGHHFENDGAKIYYEIVGNFEAPPLLMLHGGLGTIEELNGVVEALSNDFKIIGIDCRGQGKSTFGKTTLSYELFQQDVLAVLEHLNIKQLSIFGFSAGGIVAYRMAAQTSLSINKVVTVGANWAMKKDDPVTDIYKKVTAKSWREKFPDTYDIYQKINPEPDFDKLVPAIVAMWLDDSSKGCPADSVKNIRCPLLIIRGDNDHLVSAMALIELRRLVETSEFFNIPSAGHMAFIDQREILLAGVKPFLLK